MKHFRRLGCGLPVTPILEQLAAHADLWDRHPIRRTFTNTPHGEMRDIWVRMRAQAELTTIEAYKTAYIPVFYPAWPLLPALRPIVFDLMAQVDAVQLGPVLITRLPPGGRILPHDDRGSWSAEFFNLKAHVTLANDGGCINECCGEQVVMQPGEAWTFDNLTPHNIQNNGTTDRIVLIVSMRVEP